MKSNIPWSVKGIDPEAREAAKIAARKAGMTLGEWLNSLILQSGELPEGFEHLEGLVDEDEIDSDDDSLTEDEDPNQELEARINNLTRKLDQSDRQAAVSGIDESIERLASTIESSRRMVPSSENAQKIIIDLTHRLERISARVEEVASQPRSGIEPKTLMALERAIAGVASHIEKSDRRNTELVQSVETALAQIGTRVDGAESVAVNSVGRVDAQLDRLATRIDNAESEARRSAARLSERLGQIDERLSHSAIERESTLSAVERRLAGFDAKLQTVQARLETAAAQAARSNIPPDAVTRMELEEANRRHATDLNAESAGLKRSVTAIESRLSTLLDRLDRLRVDTDSQLREIDRKSDEALRQAQAKANAAPDPETGAAIDTLKQNLNEIGEKFNRSNHTATETMSALEGVLRSLTRRLDVLEGRQPRAAEASPVPAPEPAAPLPPRPAVTTAPATGDLPKRPTWSWGVSRQEPEEPAAKQEPETIAEPAQAEPPRARRSAAEDDLRSRFRLGARDIVEVIEPAHEDEEASIEDIATEPMGTEAEANAPHATGVEEAGAVADYVAAEADTPEAEREIDFSSLQFDLGDAREEPAGESAWSSDRPNLPARTEPRIDTEIEPEPASASSGTYLEQARRAAKAAGPGERIGDFDIEEDHPDRGRLYMIVGAVVAALAIVIAVMVFLRPLLMKPAAPGAHHATATAGAPSVAGKPPGAIASTTQPPAASTESASAPPPAEPGAPSENSIGPQLPDDSAAPAKANTAANTQAPAPAAQSPLDALKGAAQAGNPRALYALALDDKSGRDGVEANSVQAVNLMTEAANKNLAVAERTLGVWYEQGDGVPKDIGKAREWYEKAAQGGDYQAMHNLGYFYAQGLGGLTADSKMAAKWFKQAADRGLVASQVNLAIVYSQMGQNDQAYFYSKIAADRDPSDKDAPRMRDTFGPMLPADVKAKMDEAAKTWQPQPIDLAANGGFDTSPDAFVQGAPAAELSKDELKSIQELLNEQGFKAGTADGHPGAQTVTAIKVFQAKYGLQQTGAPTKDLLAALESVPH